MPALYALLSVVAVSAVSILAAVPFLIKKRMSRKTLLFLLSLSVGVLMGAVFFDLLPEAFTQGYSITIAFTILLGFLAMFIIETVIHAHTTHYGDPNCKHITAHLAPMNLIGDGVHNFLDGLVIAGSYAVSVPLGVATTIAVVFHEVPQEIGDVGVLLYAGLSKAKVVFFNLMSALTAVLGAVAGIFLAGKTETFSILIVPFAAGNFIYIAASNLVPELHKHCKAWDTILHIFAIAAGVAIIVAVSVLVPE